jgi:formate-dependent nitrite reductase membrane component NrfD
MLFLGRPLRFWRAAWRPDRSWIARGIWAMGIFAISGLACLAPRLMGPAWQLPAGVEMLAEWLAGLSALFIMFYDGLLMSASPAIPFWRTPMLPLLVLMYATLGGTTLSLTLRGIMGVSDQFVPVLLQGERLLLLINLLFLGVYLLRMSRWAPASRETVRLLLSGTYAWAFVGIVVTVGLIATLLLSLAAEGTAGAWLLIVIAACELTGDYTLLLLLLKSALFTPQSAYPVEAVR